jgi:phosphatidylinositol alpha 1,6-mannosyltransferase
MTLIRLVGFLEEKGYDLLVFGPTIDNPPVKHKGTLVPVRSIAAPTRSEYRISLGLGRKARLALRAFDPEFYHIATPDLLGLAALRDAVRQKIPVVASYHTHFSAYLKYYRLGSAEGILWRYLRWFYEHCEHIYVPTPSMAEVLASHSITRGVRLWERGVDTSLFAPSRRSVKWRQTLDLEDWRFDGRRQRNAV